MGKVPVWLRSWVYPIAVVGSLGLVITLAVILSGRGLRGFLAPLDQSNGSPRVILKTADNAIETQGFATLINHIGDTTQSPDYLTSPDHYNQLMPTPEVNDKKYDLFRIQGRIEVEP